VIVNGEKSIKMLKTSPFVPHDVRVGILQVQCNQEKKQLRKRKSKHDYSLHNSGLSYKRANQKR
jgi:hypothetical protein